MTPARIQRRRVKGWKIPEGAVYVGRGSKWGNPFTAANSGAVHPALRFACEVAPLKSGSWFAPLRGKSLACWCQLCDRHKDGLPSGVKCPDCAPCHADVLLELANH